MRTLVAAAVACSVLMGLSHAADVKASIKTTVSIPAQGLGPALQALSKERDFHVVFISEDVAAMRTAGAEGDLTVEEALQQLLSGTGLTYRYIGEETVSILPLPTAPASQATSGIKKMGAGIFRFAQGAGAQNDSQSDTSKSSQASESGSEESAKESSADSSASDTNASPFMLEEVVVSGRKLYGTQMNTTGRLAQPYIDTPQMVSVVTSDFLRDAKLFSSEDAVMFVPGLNKTRSVVQGMRIRGIETSASYIDGFSNLSPVIFDIAFMDRVEVVKGPSSTSFGRGDPTGFINYVTKRPTFGQSTEVQAMLGTGNDDRMTQQYVLDNNGIVTTDGETAYRFVGSYGSGASTRDFSEYERAGGMLAVARNFNEKRGRLSVTTLYAQANNPPAEANNSLTDEAFRLAWNGLEEQFGGQLPDFQVFNGDYAVAFSEGGYLQGILSSAAVFEYKLSENWSTRQAVHYHSLKSEGKWTGANAGSISYSGDGTLLIRPDRILQERRASSLAYQADFIGQFSLPSLNAKLDILAGGDYSKVDVVSALTGQSAPSAQAADPWNPNVTLPAWTVNIDNVGTRLKGTEWSAYTQVQGRVWDERVHLTAAFRKIYRDQDVITRAFGTKATVDTKTPILPTYSVLVKMRPWLSVYGLYSEYRDAPTVSPEFAGLDDPLDPRLQRFLTVQPQTKLKEVGIKGTLFDDAINYSVAKYWVEQSGAARFSTEQETGPDGTVDGFAHFFLSQDTVDGIEFEAFGQWGQKLTFLFNGSFADSHVSQAFFGPRFDSRMRDLIDTVSAYATYSFGPSRGQGLSVTAGAKTYLSGWELLGLTLKPFSYPKDITVVDLGVSYGINDRYEIYVKGNNVFHEHAVPVAEQASVSGRQIFVGLNARF